MGEIMGDNTVVKCGPAGKGRMRWIHQTLRFLVCGDLRKATHTHMSKKRGSVDVFDGFYMGLR